MASDTPQLWDGVPWRAMSFNIQFNQRLQITISEIKQRPDVTALTRSIRGQVIWGQSSHNNLNYIYSTLHSKYKQTITMTKIHCDTSSTVYCRAISDATTFIQSRHKSLQYLHWNSPWASPVRENKINYFTGQVTKTLLHNNSTIINPTMLCCADFVQDPVNSSYYYQ